MRNASTKRRREPEVRAPARPTVRRARETESTPAIDLSTGRWRVTQRKKKKPGRLTLRTIREGMGKTQGDVARALETEQSEISRIERRPDVLLSTLRKYAAAIGAECEVAFVFPAGHRVLVADPPDGSVPDAAVKRAK